MSDLQNDVLLGDLKPFEHQIAGHVYQEGQGMLTCTDGTVLKPVLQDPRGEREVKFYEKIFKAQAPDIDVLFLRSFLPSYDGVVKLAGSKEIQGSERYLKLQDLTSSFKFPCIMDIKVGKRTWDQYATEKKIAMEKSKSPLQSVVGFRLGGVKVYNKKTKTFDFYDRHFCRKISTISELHSVFITYLEGAQDIHIKQAILSNIIAKLKEIQEWFSKQKNFSFTSSSLLIIYEADCTRQDNKETINALQSSQTEVKMIDFSHVYESSDFDINYQEGIESIIHHLEECLSLIGSSNVDKNYLQEINGKSPWRIAKK